MWKIDATDVSLALGKYTSIKSYRKRGTATENTTVDGSSSSSLMYNGATHAFGDDAAELIPSNSVDYDESNNIYNVPTNSSCNVANNGSNRVPRVRILFTES